MIWRAAIALAIAVLPASAAELSLDQATIAAGKPADLHVTLKTGKDLPTGVQFDLEYDATALDLSVEAGPAALQASKNLRTAVQRPGKLRALIIGFNRNTISDGVIAVIHVAYKGAEGGKTFPIHVTAVAGTDADARPVAVTAKDGSVKVDK